MNILDKNFLAACRKQDLEKKERGEEPNEGSIRWIDKDGNILECYMILGDDNIYIPKDKYPNSKPDIEYFCEVYHRLSWRKLQL